MAVVTYGCGGQVAAPAATRPADKATCEEIVPGWVPQGVGITDRRLVPLSQELLGVEAEYRGDVGYLRLVSGGYLDDILEPYDNLKVVASGTVLGDRAEISEGSFVGAPVYAATWHAPRLEASCATRALIAVGIPESDFYLIIEHLDAWQPGLEDG